MATITPERERSRAKEILEILREKIPIRSEDFASLVVGEETKDPFRVLIVAILSQSCTDLAALRAYRQLDQSVGITPNALGRVHSKRIQNAIREAGLHKQKARSLKQLAKIIDERYSGDLGGLLQCPIDLARQSLQELPNVGPKTADVLLSVWGQPTISVDTHVNRVSKRLGLALPKAKYEEVRSALMELFPTDDYRFVPLVLMALGRRFCKARQPHCPSCPVEKLCPYPGKTR